MELTGKKVTIVGLARSGAGAARLLAGMGAAVTVTDRKSERELSHTVIPPPMPNTGTADQYSTVVKRFSQQILPAGLPATTVWSYGAANNLAGTLNYPSFTIEGVRDTQTTVTWINGLVDGSGNYLPHLLPVDPTLHWANPPGGNTGRDSRPTFATTPGPYTGPVPLVTHVHGMEGVQDCFGAIYQDHMVSKIHRALKRLQAK